MTEICSQSAAMICAAAPPSVRSVRERIFALPVPVQWVILSLLITVVSVFGYYGPGYDAGSFIYGAF